MDNSRDDVRDRLSVIRRYLGASLIGHLLWEVVQLPLFTLWTTGTRGQKAFAVVHCTAGDVMITSFALLAAVVLFGRSTWPSSRTAAVTMVSIVLGVAYTVFSEWLNTNVRASWAYSELMPVVPVLGTGAAPLLQWIVVPTTAMWFALGHAPWIEHDRL